MAGAAAVYVDPYAVESIAGGMRKVLTDKQLAVELAAKGLENVKRFIWQKSAERLHEIIEREITKKEVI